VVLNDSVALPGGMIIMGFGTAEYAIQIFALFVALEQLDIGTQLLTALFVIVFGAVFLALAIAFGLGGRDWAAKIISKFDKSNKP